MNKLTDKQLYKLCQEFGANARKWKRKFEALLPEVEKRKLYKKHGFYSIFEFAAKIGGVGRKSVEEILRVSRKIENKPLLKAEMETQGWAKIRAVSRLVENEDEEKLVEIVKTMPIRVIEETVRLKKRDETPNVWESKSVTMSFSVDSNTEFKLRKFKQKIEKEKGEKISFNEVLKELLTKVEEVPKKERKVSVEKKPTTTRYVPAAKKREVEAKHKGKCAFLGCNKPHEVLHHPNRWAFTKNHKKITPLCKTHHQLAHSGMIENESDLPDNWRIRQRPKQNSVDQKMMAFVTG
jgi:hypothetical protein